VAAAVAVVASGAEVLGRIKADLDACVGKRVRFRVRQGRRRYVEGEGVLEGTYRNVFVIVLGCEGFSTLRVSYAYADVLTRTVEVAEAPAAAKGAGDHPAASRGPAHVEAGVIVPAAAPCQPWRYYKARRCRLRVWRPRTPRAASRVLRALARLDLELRRWERCRQEGGVEKEMPSDS
jgi:uncharacterized protein Veg